MNDPYSSTKNGICSGMSEWILVYLLIPDRPETSFFQTSGWRPYQQKGPLFIIFLVQTAPTDSYASILQHICSHCWIRFSLSVASALLHHASCLSFRGYVLTFAIPANLLSSYILSSKVILNPNGNNEITSTLLIVVQSREF